MNRKLNILVTGSKGFIGKNFLCKLKNENVNIFEFNRSNTEQELVKYLVSSDIVFHLAGEVRPTSSDEDFKKSNTILTKKIVDILSFYNKRTKIILTSSIHAELQKNEYGKTKRESEMLIEEYSSRNNVSCVLLRLPHLFGEGCKPNYNSVVSTWIYNSINDLEINVFDRNIKMEYIYVQDLVMKFTDLIYEENNEKFNYLKEMSYKTTLGEVVDYINEFKNNLNNDKYLIDNKHFKLKLFNTYMDYYRKINVV